MLWEKLLQEKFGQILFLILIEVSSANDKPFWKSYNGDLAQFQALNWKRALFC